MKNKEPNQFASMTREELQAKLSESSEALFRLHFKHASNPLKDPMQIRKARRDVARLKTYLTQKDKA